MVCSGVSVAGVAGRVGSWFKSQTLFFDSLDVRRPSLGNVKDIDKHGCARVRGGGGAFEGDEGCEGFCLFRS